MDKLKISDLVNIISKLSFNKTHQYYKGKTFFKIVEVTSPEGPIKIKRWKNHETEKDSKYGSISSHQLAIAASVFNRKPNYPVHFDRLFSGSGNTRGAFESILALTPNFFICYPSKTNPYTGLTEDKLKHIMWCPGDYHQIGEFREKKYNQIISELELDTDFGNIVVDQSMVNDEFTSIETKRIHTQMQVALIRIGFALNFRTWIAKNDRSIQIEDTILGKLEGVVDSLEKIPILYHDESKKAASLIDCIWFSEDFKYIPAVIEVEHSTGVTSGFTRMLKLKETIPSVSMGYTVVAPNELRDKVISEANNNVFRSLDARYMSYSTIRELYGLIKRYNLNNVVDRKFIEPFMEIIVE